MLRLSALQRFYVKRVGFYFLTFLAAMTLNFVLPELRESNPVDKIMAKKNLRGMSAEEITEERQRIKEKFGLDQHVFVRFLKYCKNMLVPVYFLDDDETLALTEERLNAAANAADVPGEKRDDAVNAAIDAGLTDDGFDEDAAVAAFLEKVSLQKKPEVNRLRLGFDYGYSILRYPERVWDIVKKSILWTLALQIPTVVIGYSLGNVLGALAAYKRGFWDKVLYPMSLLFTSTPYFCLGLILVYVFGIVLQWFPALGGYSDAVTFAFSWDFLTSAAYHYVLPFMAMFLVLMGGQAIGMRSMSIYELGSDYVNYARYLGIRENKIVMYVFRNAMLPQLTGLALQLGMMIGGALLIEMIFSYPGIGTEMFKAVIGNDYPVIQAGALIVSANVLMFNLVVDILIAKLDPRVKAGLEAEE
ncbi:MAG: ABC transporter permease [Fibrobacterota bacterium]